MSDAARHGSLRRYLLGCVGIVLCTSIAVAAVAIGAVTTIAADIALGGKPLSSPVLRAADVGAAQTILVIGDDHIGPTTTYSTGAEQTVNGYHYLHADTFMLVRMDPAQGQTSILSIPRDMLVNFTWKGVPYTNQKFNSTYSIGGYRLVLQVASKLLPGVTINHVIDVNFASFLGLIHAIGCVYVDVDRHYLNQYDHTYQLINVEPGYQRLCGNNALEYVRYRHTDSDFVRVARQQDFIRQAKEQLGVWGFVSRWQSLAKAFGRAVGTDIRGGQEVSALIQLAIYSISRPIRQVHFQVSDTSFPVGNEVYVVSTPQLIQATIGDFLGSATTTAGVAARSVTASSTSNSSSSTVVHHHHHHHHVSASPAGTDGLIALTSGVSQRAGLLGVSVPFPVELPTVQTAAALPNDFYPYKIGDESHHLHYGYRIDWQIDTGGYYGIEGMNWTNPPLFANPSATETINGRTYMFILDGRHYHDIGWRSGNDLYWVSNTLLEELSNAQMLKIAESAQPIG